MGKFIPIDLIFRILFIWGGFKGLYTRTNGPTLLLFELYLQLLPITRNIYLAHAVMSNHIVGASTVHMSVHTHDAHAVISKVTS